MKLQKYFFAAVIVLSANAAFAQNDDTDDFHTLTINIPAVALLDLETTGALDFTLAGEVTNDEAGLPISFLNAEAKNSNTWINYSSILGTTASRQVTVSITAGGTVPIGLELTVSAGVDAGSGDGAIGTSTTLVTPIILSTTAKKIITGVGSSYTGDGASKGHQLTYQLGLDTSGTYTYDDLDSANSADLEITYTLLDE